MSVSGTPIFNALALARLEVNFTGQSLEMKAIAVFVNTETGASHGSTTASGQEWSQATLKLLSDLRLAMEEDLAVKHFTQFTPGAAKPGLQLPGGLGEHLSADAPSV